MDDAGLSATSATRERQGLRAVIEADASDAAENQSLRWMRNEIEYDGNYFGDFLDEGHQSLVAAMAAGTDIRLGVEVTEVAVTSSGVSVSGARGAIERGSHAVVTVPLGVLRHGKPRFVPALPPDRTAAIERLGFGRYEKVAARLVTRASRDRRPACLRAPVAGSVRTPTRMQVRCS